MSTWHLIWILPIVVVVSMGGSFVHAAHWLTVALRSEDKIGNFIEREIRMAGKFWITMASFALVMTILTNEIMFGIALRTFLIWGPMLAVLGGYTLIHHTRLPQKWLLSLAAGFFIAPTMFGFENWLFGTNIFDVWTWGIPIGLFTAYAQVMKDWLKRETGLAWEYHWLPWDQIFYVTGGWVGYMFVTKGYFDFSMGIVKDGGTLLILWLLAVLYAVAADFLSPVLRKSKRS